MTNTVSYQCSCGVSVGTEDNMCWSCGRYLADNAAPAQRLLTGGAVDVLARAHIEEQKEAARAHLRKGETVAVFVYGTLMKGYGLHDSCLGKYGLTPIPDSIKAELHMVTDAHFPAITELDKTNKITHGEVYMLPGHMLATLDSVEGVPVLYVRQHTTTLRNKLTVWVYAWAGWSSPGPEIPGGHFGPLEHTINDVISPDADEDKGGDCDIRTIYEYGIETGLLDKHSHFYDYSTMPGDARILQRCSTCWDAKPDGGVKLVAVKSCPYCHGTGWADVTSTVVEQAQSEQGAALALEQDEVITLLQGAEDGYDYTAD